MEYIFTRKKDGKKITKDSELMAKNFVKTLDDPKNYVVMIYEFGKVMEKETEIETIFNLNEKQIR